MTLDSTVGLGTRVGVALPIVVNEDVTDARCAA
jgi:hypothetical protein